MNWTQIILALISTIGGIVTTVFAVRAKGSASEAGHHADAAREASLRPPPDRPTPVDPPGRLA